MRKKRLFQYILITLLDLIPIAYLLTINNIIPVSQNFIKEISFLNIEVIYASLFFLSFILISLIVYDTRNLKKKIMILSILQKIPGVDNQQKIKILYIKQALLISYKAAKTNDIRNLSEINQLIEQLENGSITKDLLDKMERILNPINEQLFSDYVLGLLSLEEINELYPIESKEQEEEPLKDSSQEFSIIESNEQEAEPLEDSSQEFSIIKMVKENPSMPYIYAIYKAKQKDNTNTLNNFKTMLKENKDKILEALLKFNEDEGKQSPYQSPYIKKKNEQTRLRFIHYDLNSLEEGLQPTEEVKENTISDMLTEDQVRKLNQTKIRYKGKKMDEALLTGLYFLNIREIHHVLSNKDVQESINNRSYCYAIYKRYSQDIEVSNTNLDIKEIKSGTLFFLKAILQKDFYDLEDGLYQATSDNSDIKYIQEAKPSINEKDISIAYSLFDIYYSNKKHKDIGSFRSLIRNILYNINSVQELEHIKNIILMICPGEEKTVDDAIKQHFNQFDSEVSELNGLAREVIEYIEPNNNAPAPKFPPSSSFNTVKITNPVGKGSVQGNNTSSSATSDPSEASSDNSKPKRIP